MTAIGIEPVQDGVSFGARVTGVSWDNVRDSEVRARILDAFEQSGVLVFAGVESTSEMQVEIASMFGPLRPHAMAEVSRTDVGAAASLMELYSQPGDQNVVELDGKPLAGRTPWHWDACYAPQIYRGGVIRALEMPSEGGETGFADGIQCVPTCGGFYSQRQGYCSSTSVAAHQRTEIICNQCVIRIG